jgi:hypothetical protein
MTNDELKRQSRVTDQMVTAYSVLRDRYASRATSLTLGILGSSVVLVACTFLPDDALSNVGISPFITKVIIGVFSSFVLFLSIAELRVDWRERSRLYAEAAESLAKHKSKYRAVLSKEESTSSAQIAEMTKGYSSTMDGLPRIPDKQFIKLKAYHLKKVRLSQLVYNSVGCPVWVLRLRILFQGWRGKTRSDKEEIA